MRKKITIAALLIGLAGTTFGIMYYVISAENKKDARLDEPQEEIKANQEEESIKKEKQKVYVHEEIKFENGYEEKRKDIGIAKENSAPINEQASKNNSPSLSRVEAIQDMAIKRQISRLYEDLFKELALPEEQRKRVEDHLVKSMKSESEFDFKLLDPNISVDEILRDQDRLSRELRGDFGGILSEREQELVMKHQSDFPKKVQKSQIMMLVNNLNLDGNEKEKVKSAVEHAVQNLEGKKKIGEYTAQDIVDYRKLFNGAKPGEPEFLRATIETSANRVKALLKDLEQLPKDQYEAIKKQMEMPLEMMQQALKHQTKQS